MCAGFGNGLLWQGKAQLNCVHASHCVSLHVVASQVQTDDMPKFQQSAGRAKLKGLLMLHNFRLLP